MDTIIPIIVTARRTDSPFTGLIQLVALLPRASKPQWRWFVNRRDVRREVHLTERSPSDYSERLALRSGWSPRLDDRVCLLLPRERIETKRLITGQYHQFVGIVIPVLDRYIRSVQGIKAVVSHAHP